MKHYLDLVKISAKKRKRQSRMTRICIVLAVFLVSSIFGMADMEIQSQMYQAIQSDGSWHAVFAGLDEEEIHQIRSRAEVESASRYAVTNYGLDEGYTIGSKETVVCGFDENFQELMPDAEIDDGRFPSGRNEAAVTKSVRTQMDLEKGDTVTLRTPSGTDLEFIVTGFCDDTSMLTSQDAFGFFVNTDTYEAYFMDDTPKEDFQLYVKFSPFCNIQRTISDIREQFHLDEASVGQNTKVLSLMFQTNDPYMMQLYFVAAILAILVSTAGILMISGSLNSNVARRTKFFGMLRCIGADQKQIRRFVRREALGWCKSAIPAGLLLSVIVVWGLCAMLRVLSPMYFAGMPVVGISWIGIAAGALIGFVTVLLAARSPAKKASAVSPLTAVSGNDGSVRAVRKAANTRLFRIETALGIHHAAGSRKNFILMAGSFAFSIILFLSFSPAVDFMNHALKPLQPSAPDLSIEAPENDNSISRELADTLENDPVVKRVYGRSYCGGIPAEVSGGSFTAYLVSYEEDQFRWAEDDLMNGSFTEAVNGNGVLAVYMDSDRKFDPGEEMTLELPGGTEKVEICGTLSESMFNVPGGSVFFICSEDLFTKLTGIDGYSEVDVQFTSEVTDRDVEKIRALAGEGLTVADERMSNSETREAYYSFALFLYGFLAVIALISIFNIVNSIAMSVSARMNEYGAMCAIGMSIAQMVRMVAAETASYVFWGIVAGCGAGLPLNYKIYDMLVTSRWGDGWYFPAAAVAVIVGVMILSAVMAVWGPAKQIREMSVVDTISAL
ncbi:MAG TPA: FtsX-like permease family protein [Candidatus Mediterraneibacter faecavium]|uniref:FtsX-like permease family protein n=1 Tax=Candidatus Mediterraneibacter faecavium TaxID=2838668 RepID=A0A9D2Q643_9FIRM|nr:FtsX-like permease family protein [Candidatus Mediterraneibacter faecavium]